MEIQFKLQNMHLVDKNSTILGRSDYAFNFEYRVSNVHIGMMYCYGVSPVLVAK